jgi:hypothetical protein
MSGLRDIHLLDLVRIDNHEEHRKRTTRSTDRTQDVAVLSGKGCGDMTVIQFAGFGP